MYPGLFKMRVFESFSLYEWFHSVSSDSYSSALLFDTKDELLSYLILAKYGLSMSKGKCTITFTNDKGECITLVPIDWDRIIERDLNTLYSYLKERRFRWLNIPEVFFMNSGSKISSYGCGQIIVLPSNTLATPYISLSLVERYIQGNNNNIDDFNVSIPVLQELVEHPVLRYRLCYLALSDNKEEWLNIFGIDKEFDLIPNELSIPTTKYCVQSLTLVLPELTDKQAEFLNDRLYSINCYNFQYSYSIDYKVVKVGSVWQLHYYVYDRTVSNYRKEIKL